MGSKKWTSKWGPFSLSYCNKSRNPILGSTFWTPKWGPPLATCLTILGDALCGSFRIPALSLLNRICSVGAGYLMTSKAAGKSCVSAFVSAQRRPFMGAPVCCEFWTPFWGSEGSLSSKDDTHSCSKPATSHLHDFSNHSLELQHTLLKFCASSVKLQSRKTKVSLHMSNIHVPCC